MGLPVSFLRRNGAYWAGLLVAAATLAVPAGAARAATAPGSIAHYYNALRTANGIPGGLKLSSARSADCALHNHYAALNGNDRPNPHQETPGKPGYTTGGDWAARNSELEGGSGLVSVWAPFNRGNPYWSAPFAAAPFHLMGLLNPANTTIWGADTENGLCVGESGTRAVPASDTLYSFPGPGKTIPWAEPYPNEYPTSPEAVAGIRAGTITGPVLMTYWRGPDNAGNPLDRLTTATLTGPGGPVTVDIVSTPQSALVPSGAGFVIPRQPLKPGAAYTASVTFSTATDAVDPRSWTHSFSFRTSAPRSAAALVHVGAVPKPKHHLVFTMTSDFPAAGRPATLKVTTSNPLLHIQGGRGSLPGAGVVNVYPVAAPEPGGWVKLALTVPAYTVAGVHVAKTTVSKTVHGPPLSTLLSGFAPKRSYSTGTVAGRGIALSFRVKRPGTVLQAALQRGRTLYAFSARVKSGHSGRVKLVLRAPAAALRALLGRHSSARVTVALRIAEPGMQQFEIDRTTKIAR